MDDAASDFVGPADLIISALSHDLDRTVIEMADDGTTVTARAFRDHVAGFAGALNDLRLASGSRLGLLARNRVEVLYVQAAVAFTDLCLVPLHPMAAQADLEHVAADAELSALVYDPAFYRDSAAALGVAIPKLRLLSLGPGADDDLISMASSRKGRRLVAPRSDPDAVVRLTYSGGTTGRPKAIMGTQRYTVTMLQTMLTEWEWPHVLRQLVCSPLSHAGGAALMPALLRKGTLVVLPGFEPGKVLAAIERFRITAVLLVPTMIYAMLDHPDLADRDTSSLECIYYGASSIIPSRLAEAIRVFGPVFFQFYGQAEAPMSITILRRGDHDADDLERLRSCGRPTPWNRVALLDDDGGAVPDGSPGEICVKGPMVMAGYLARPEETADAFEGGWLHTGDVAIRDEHGFLTIVDRKKDMIVTGGFNVYPREIEDVLAADASVSEVAVVGAPDPRWGEAVTAFVVARVGHAIDVDALVSTVRATKGSLHAPKRIVELEALPRTGLGKTDKKALRAMLASLVDK